MPHPLLHPTAFALVAAAAATLASGRAHAQSYAPAPRYVTVTSPDQLPPGARVVYVDAYGRPIDPAQPPATPPPQPPERPLAPARVVLGLTLGAQIYTDSAFNHVASLWGYGGVHSAVDLALDGGVHLNPWILIGARVGYANGGGGTAFADGASLILETFDVDAIARFGAPVPLGHRWVFYPAAQLELGGEGAWLSLRGDAQSALLPRIGGVGMMTFSSEHVGLSIRAGYRWANWGSAGGQGTDLSLAGAYVGLGLEVRL